MHVAHARQGSIQDRAVYLSSQHSTGWMFGTKPQATLARGGECLSNMCVPLPWRCMMM